MNPDIGPLLLVVVLAVAAFVYAKVLHWRAARLEQTIGRHRAPAGRSTVRLVRGKFRWDLGVQPQVTR